MYGEPSKSMECVLRAEWCRKTESNRQYCNSHTRRAAILWTIAIFGSLIIRAS